MRTRVTNTSGAAGYMGFIPPHGASLADGASVVLDGDLRTVLAGGRGRYTRRRELASLDNALAEGAVAVAEVADPSSSSSSASPP